MPDSKQPQPYYVENDEITLKELIFKIQEFWQEIQYNWKLIFVFILVFVIIFLGKAWLTTPVYTAELTFMLNEDDGENSNTSAILGQFGLGRGKNSINIYKMIELAKSRKIVSMVLLEKIKINEKEDFIANYIIKEYNWHKQWEDNELLNGFLFQHNNINKFNITENRVLKILHKMFVNEEDGLMSLSATELTGIFILTITTTNEFLSLNCTNILYNKLGEYYIEKTTNKQQATYDRLVYRTDSLEQALNNKQLSVLKFQDSNRNLILKQSEIQQLKLQGEVQKLIVTYNEAYKQLQVAEYTLKNKMPFITTIDEPVYPISPKREPKILAILIGSLLGIFLSLIFIVSRKIYRDALA